MQPLDGYQRRAGAAQLWWTPARRHYVLFVLCLVGLVNFIDRQILAILLQSIKADLNASDTAMGMLSGIAFAAAYAIAGIPLARLADRRSRRGLLTACLAVWSAATMLCGFAANIVHLALARIGVAAGEAGGSPITQSLLGDLYPAERRGTVIGIWAAAQAIGIAFGLFLGGWLNTALGWRAAFVVVGAPGLVLAAILFLTVREPPRGLSDPPGNHVAAPPAGSLRDAVALILGEPALRFAILIGMSCAFAGYSILAWGPAFYLRVHGLTVMQVGLYMGIGMAGGTFCGSLLSGIVADRYARGDLTRYPMVSGWGTLLAAPPGLLFLLADDVTLSLIGVALTNFFLVFYMAPNYAVALGLAGPHHRGLVTALLGVAMSLVGAGLGPLFVGVASDLLIPAFGAQSLRYALLIALLGVLASAALCFRSIPAIRRAVAARVPS